MTQGPVTAGLVTIVIPTYNDDPEHIHDSVGSALAQSYPMTEVVVVDDGSTRSDSIEALAALDGVRLITQPNSGPSAARNTGIRAGSGEFVICLDADDLLAEELAAEAVTLLNKHADAAIAYPRMEPFGGPREVWPTRGRLTLADFAQRSAVPVGSAFRRTAWDQAGGWDESMRTGMEDHEWWIRLLGVTGGVALPMPRAVHHYRVRPGSRSRTRPYSDDLEVTRRRILANNPPPVHRTLLEGAWSATDSAEADAAAAWSDPWQLRRWGRALRRRLHAERAFVTSRRRSEAGS